MIKVNENTCIGCGACVAISPENFDFNDAGLSKVISEVILESTQEAVDACPVSAISISASTSKDEKIIDLTNNNENVNMVNDAESTLEENEIAA